MEKSILDPQLKVSRYRFSNFLVLMSQKIRGDSPAEIADMVIAVVFLSIQAVRIVT